MAVGVAGDLCQPEEGEEELCQLVEEEGPCQPVGVEEELYQPAEEEEELYQPVEEELMEELCQLHGQQGAHRGAQGYACGSRRQKLAVAYPDQLLAQRHFQPRWLQLNRRQRMDAEQLLPSRQRAK